MKKMPSLKVLTGLFYGLWNLTDLRINAKPKPLHLETWNMAQKFLEYLKCAIAGSSGPRNWEFCTEIPWILQVCTKDDFLEIEHTPLKVQILVKACDSIWRL